MKNVISPAGLLQLAFVPLLIIVILVLLGVIIWLAIELRRLRAQAQVAPQRLAPTPSFAPVSPSSVYRPYSPPEAQKWQRAEVPQHYTGSNVSGMNTLVSARQRDIPEQDKPESDERWLKLVTEDIDLFDDLDKHLAALDPASQKLAEHVLLQLQEILERSGVQLIDGETTFDRHRHQPDKPGAGGRQGMTIVETLSPGFIVGQRVLRRARVRLADQPPAKTNEQEGL